MVVCCCVGVVLLFGVFVFVVVVLFPFVLHLQSSSRAHGRIDKDTVRDEWSDDLALMTRQNFTCFVVTRLGGSACKTFVTLTLT